MVDRGLVNATTERPNFSSFGNSSTSHQIPVEKTMATKSSVNEDIALPTAHQANPPRPQRPTTSTREAEVNVSTATEGAPKYLLPTLHLHQMVPSVAQP